MFYPSYFLLHPPGEAPQTTPLLREPLPTTSLSWQGKCYQGWLHLTSVFFYIDSGGEQKQQCDVLQPSSYTITHFHSFYGRRLRGKQRLNIVSPPSSAACDWLAEQCRTSGLERRRRRRWWQWGGQAGGAVMSLFWWSQWPSGIVTQTAVWMNSGIVVTARLCCFMSHRHRVPLWVQPPWSLQSPLAEYEGEGGAGVK